MRDKTETYSPDQATFQQAATRSGPHSQHPWRCRKHDAIPSLCLSLRTRQLEDLPAESTRSMANGLAQEPHHPWALSVSLGSTMVNAHSSKSSSRSPGLSTSPSLSTALGGSVAAYAHP